MDITHAIFEVDAQQVAHGIMSSVENISEFGTLISRCRNISVSEPNYEIEFFRRQTNMMSHSLARGSRSEGSYAIT
jgi:hypothetical protein